MRKRETAMSDDQRYCGAGIPRKVPTGRVLAHNCVQHTPFMMNGQNGFRCWTWPKGKVPSGFVKCPCGWSGLPHVALREHVKATKGKCATLYQVLRNGGMAPAMARLAIKSIKKLAAP